MIPLVLLLLTVPDGPSFESAKYGVAFNLPADWTIAVREKNEYIVVARVPQADPDLPGAFACQLGLAPESLDEYRTRIDANAARGLLRGKLVRNEILKAPGGDRLLTVREFQPPGMGTWHEVTVRLIAHRQVYTFTLNVDDATHAERRPAFGTLIDAVRFSPPDTGLDPDPQDKERPRPRNRWIQRADRFAIDLPEDWKPALAPTEMPRLFANGPAHGMWSDNVLVLAQPPREQDLDRLALQLPEDLRREDPTCEVLACKVVPRGDGQALETIVRTQRGSFSMTVLEHRFRGERSNFEIKYTMESKRFDVLLPVLRQSIEGFQELPGALAAPRPDKVD